MASVARWLIIGGLIFAFAPFAIAFVTGLLSGTSMWDEGNGTGTYLWFLIITLPVGIGAALVGVILALVEHFRS